MTNNLQKLIYNLSAASPICFVFAVIWYIQKKTYIVPAICIGVGILLTVLFFVSFAYGLKHLAPISIRTSDISPNDSWIVLYIFTYLFPFASMVIDDFNLIICGIIAFLVASAAPFVNSAIPNPLLSIKKYHFYQVSGENGISGYVLISKRKYRKKQDLKYVNRMFDFLLMDAEGG